VAEVEGDWAALATLVKTHRRRLGIPTQGAAAERAGFSPNTWQRLESGKPISMRSLSIVAAVLGWYPTDPMKILEHGIDALSADPTPTQDAPEAARPQIGAIGVGMPAEADPLTPQQVIAQTLHHIADEGHTVETALAVADDVIHALQAAGHRIIQGEIPAEIRLLTAVRAAVDESGIRHVHLSRTLGLTTKHLSSLLTGKTPLSIGWADRIATACGLSLDIRVGGDGER
jgi:hypothetical protein